MKIPQMLLGAIALSVGITIAAANSDAEQYAKKCVLPYPEMDNDTTKKQTKPISEEVKDTQERPQRKIGNQSPVDKAPKIEKPTKIEEPTPIEFISPEDCLACGRG